MSLLVCSSAQDKYSSTSNMVVSAGDGGLPSSYQGSGIQNPAQFTNNINPVMVIPPNSEIALKDISFFKKSTFQVGVNVSFSMYIGEYIRSRWGDGARKSLYEICSLPFPIPLQEGTYNAQTFARMVNIAMDDYISHPDIWKTVWVEPWGTQGTASLNDVGYIWNMTKGAGGGSGKPPDRSAEMTTAYNTRADKDSFTYNVPGLKTYTSTAALFSSNEGIVTNIPLSHNGGVMNWDVSGATGGWRIMLTRPEMRGGAGVFRKPFNFQVQAGPAPLALETFADVILSYEPAAAVRTFRIYHAVFEDDIFQMREVEYYNNTSGDFTPSLTGVAGRFQAHMCSGTPATLALLGGHPTSVIMEVHGEDTRVVLTVGGVDYVMTDSRLCIKGNVTLIARTPTRNRFIKPMGQNQWALYPKVSLYVNGESAVLDEWSGIVNDGYLFPQPSTAQSGANGQPASSSGEFEPGSSFYMRGMVARLDDPTEQLFRMADRAKPYDSSSADAQKQYVGLDGPTVPALPGIPVRIGEGSPYIPDPATGSSGSTAYGCAFVTIPSSKGLGDWKTPGLYASISSDVSELFGFRDTSFVGQEKFGHSYLYVNAPAPASTAPPTDTAGQFFGWYVQSETDPTYSSGPLFLRCPTLTHQSYNFGKGIPSKIIATIPPDALNRDTMSGTGFFAPSELTYLTLNNTEELHFNDITLELVDKNEEIVNVLNRNTTVTLHIRKAK